ncbi:hypothetical protein, partial [Klebsiella aerogenes]|uniref:hypothetical protein n=1 Tax=Klebsiella aerogenes TaxID=548 RepID=UPI00195329A0
VEARARVDVSRPAIPQSVVVPMWTDIVEQALAETSLDAEAPVHFCSQAPTSRSRHRSRPMLRRAFRQGDRSSTARVILRGAFVPN